MTVMSVVSWMSLGIAALLASSATKDVLRIVYNASDSAPRGWYAIAAPEGLGVGDWVVARLPREAAEFAADRGYLPRAVPVLKRIGAMAGQQVCVRGGAVYIDGAAVGKVLATDGTYRSLGAWQHCRTLVSGELFLLNPAAPASYDSRYFGPIDASFVRGRAVPFGATLPERSPDASDAFDCREVSAGPAIPSSRAYPSQ